MADTPSQPPGWGSTSDSTPAPQGAPPPGPPGVPQPSGFEPPTPPQPPPGAPLFEPPPAAPQPAVPQPAAPYQPPPAAPAPTQAAAPYQPPIPGAPPPPPQQYPPQPYPAQQYGGPGQPPPPPNQGWGPPPPPAKKSNKNLWITLGVIFGVLALAIGGCTVWFVGTVKAPVDEANRFLAVVDQGNYAEAVSLSDPTCNAGFVPTDLDDLIGGRRITYDLNNSSIVNSSATVSGSFSADGLDFSQITVSLQNRDGWSVCGFTLSP